MIQDKIPLLPSLGLNVRHLRVLFLWRGRTSHRTSIPIEIDLSILRHRDIQFRMLVLRFKLLFDRTTALSPGGYLLESSKEVHALEISQGLDTVPYGTRGFFFGGRSSAYKLLAQFNWRRELHERLSEIDSPRRRRGGSIVPSRGRRTNTTVPIKRCRRRHGHKLSLRGIPFRCRFDMKRRICRWRHHVFVRRGSQSMIRCGRLGDRWIA